MFKDSINFVFVGVVGVVVDDEEDLEFANKVDVLQIKTKERKTS